MMGDGSACPRLNCVRGHEGHFGYASRIPTDSMFLHVAQDLLQSPLRLKADTGAPFSLTPATPSLSYPTPVDLVADKACSTVVVISARCKMRSGRARTYD